MTAITSPTEIASVLSTGLHLAQTRAIVDEPIVLLHGWGCDSRVWNEFADQLNQIFNVVIIDLPGFGDNIAVDRNIEAFSQLLPTRAYYLGWSLGGMVATQIAAHFPERVAGLVTLASNSQFVADDNYRAAMPEQNFADFVAGIKSTCAQTLKRFCLLSGNGLEREKLMQLRTDYGSAHAAHPDKSYLEGLHWLAELDNSCALSQLTVPSLHLFGRNDQLVPSMAAQQVQAKVAASPVAGEVVQLEAGHAIFLQQSDQVVAAVTEFIEQNKPLREKKRVALSFSNAAVSYDQAASLQRLVGHNLWKHFRSAINSSEADWLDLGSGTGYFSQFIEQELPTASVISADLALGMLTYAKSLNNGSTFIAADAEQLPFAPNTFNYLYSNLAIQWCENSAALISELQRIICPAGKAMIATLGSGSMQELEQAWQVVDQHRHVNRFTDPRVIDEIARRSGFGEVVHHSEKLTEYFPTVKALLGSLKDVGAHNVNHGQARGLSGRNKVRAFYDSYESLRTSRGYPLTYCIEYFLLTND